MQTILVVCGAGASSTFLASRIRKLAVAGGHDLTALAVSESELAGRIASAQVILVGPHLADRFDSLSDLAAKHEVAAALLPPTAFGEGGAEQAIGLAVELLAHSAPGAYPSQPTTEGHSHA